MPGIAQEGTGITWLAISAATVADVPTRAVAVRRAGVEVRRVRRQGSERMWNRVPNFHSFHIYNARIPQHLTPL